MTAIARLEVTPLADDSVTEERVQALEALDQKGLTYEMTPTGTVIEADSADEAFEAAKSAHQAIEGDRVITEVEVDDQRERSQDIGDRIAAVEEELGRPPRSS
jgi:uncharacterized protein YqgV (UPF0045/DUF77 family)